MNDDFLSQFRQPPRPEFARTLYERLAQEEEVVEAFALSEMPILSPNGTRSRRRHWDTRLTLLAAALALALFGVTITFMPDTTPDGIPVMIEQQDDQRAAITRDSASQLSKLAALGKGYLSGVRWSPDGKTLALSGSLGVWLYDADDLSQPRELLPSKSAYVPGAIFSHDGTRLAFADLTGIYFWDVATGEPLDMPLENQVNDGSAMAFSPDGRLLAMGDYEGSLHIWDLATGKIITNVNYFYSYTPIFSLTFSPDGKRLAFAGSDTPVLVLDDPSGRWRDFDGEPTVFRSSLRSEVGTRSVSFNGDGSLIAARVGNNIIIWDAATGEQVTLLDTAKPTGTPTPGTVGGGAMKGGGGDLVFSPDGSQVLTVDTAIRLWDLASRTDRLLARTRSEYSLAYAAASPDWTRVALLDTDGVVRILDMLTLEEIGSIDAHTLHSISAVTFSPDSRLLATGSDDGGIRLWTPDALDAAPLLLNAELTPYPGAQRIAFSPDGSQLAYRSMNGVARWNTSTHELLDGLQSPVERPQSIGFSGMVAYGADGHYLASTSLDNTELRVWDLQTRELAHVYEFNGLLVSEGVFLPDSAKLAVGLAPNMQMFSPDNPPDAAAAYTIQLIDTATGGGTATLAGHTDTITRLAVSPDGTRLASASNDGTVRLWDTQTGELIRIVQAENSTGAIAFSPDGTLLVAGDYQPEAQQHVVNLWDVATGEKLAAFDEDIVNDLTFSPDGRWLAVGLGRGVIDLWGVG